MSNKAKLSKKAGFTLIELLVVISIIGMLSSVVMASVSQAREKGVDASRIQTLGQIRNALELYYSDNKSYPSVPVSGKIEDLINSSGPLSPYMKGVSSNFNISGYNTKYSLNSNGGWQLFVPTKTGGAFAKNNGCDVSEYSTYNTSNGGKAYCLSNSASSGVAGSSIYTPTPPSPYGAQRRVFIMTRINGILDPTYSAGTCNLSGGNGAGSCNNREVSGTVGPTYSVQWYSGHPSGVTADPTISPSSATMNPNLTAQDIIFYVDFVRP